MSHDPGLNNLSSPKVIARGLSTQLDLRLQKLLSEMYPKLAQICAVREEKFKLLPEAHLDLFVSEFKARQGIKPINGTRDLALLQKVEKTYFTMKMNQEKSTISPTQHKPSVVENG